MLKKVGILGAGKVGRAMALDLANSFKVTSADISSQALASLKSSNSDILTEQLDLSKPESLERFIPNHDIILNAVPGYMGYSVSKQVLEAKRNLVDISFMPEDFMQLDSLAKKNSVTAVMDAGIAPGVSHLLAGFANSKMKLENLVIYVGGLPKVRTWPFNYKAPYSLCDVLEEYTRPVTIRENGSTQVVEALSGLELIESETELGTLEAFYTDGLRSLLETMPHVSTMKEKTLRYPGHTEYINVLKQSGFLSQSTLELGGKEFRPIDLTTKVLEKSFDLKEGEEDFLVMIFKAWGGGKSMTGRVFDKYREGVSAMGRTTGYTATACTNLVAKSFSEKGVFPLDLLGANQEHYDFLVDYLKQRNIQINWD